MEHNKTTVRRCTTIVSSVAEVGKTSGVVMVVVERPFHPADWVVWLNSTKED